MDAVPCVRLPLPCGRVTLVDADVAKMLEGRRVKCCERRDGKRSVVAFGGNLSRKIMDAPRGMEVDHINGDTLDNRRRNLRVCTRQQNHRNRRRSCGASRLKGVTIVRNNKPPSRWMARIRLSQVERITIGFFPTALSAALAYDDAAVKHFGEFAAPNFPERHTAVCRSPATEAGEAAT